MALADILDAFDQAENERKIEEARDSAGNDMLKMMQIVFPITTQIQMSVIGKYGFPEDGDGEALLSVSLSLVSWSHLCVIVVVPWTHPSCTTS